MKFIQSQRKQIAYEDLQMSLQKELEWIYKYSVCRIARGMEFYNIT